MARDFERPLVVPLVWWRGLLVTHGALARIGRLNPAQRTDIAKTAKGWLDEEDVPEV